MRKKLHSCALRRSCDSENVSYVGVNRKGAKFLGNKQILSLTNTHTYTGLQYISTNTINDVKTSYDVNLPTSITSRAGGRYNMPRSCKFTFDLLTLKAVSESCVTWATYVPILIFLGISVLDLGPMYATDRRQTSDAHHRLMPLP